MGAASSPARICPECGTRNSGFSLFCAECGASLTNAKLADEDDSQATAAIRPAADTPSSDPYATQQFRPQAPPASSSPYGMPTTDTYDDGGTAPYEEPESRRGLVLGWIAGILIFIVIAWLGWTSFLDADTRDSIINVFG